MLRSQEPRRLEIDATGCLPTPAPQRGPPCRIRGDESLERALVRDCGESSLSACTAESSPDHGLGDRCVCACLGDGGKPLAFDDPGTLALLSHIRFGCACHAVGRCRLSIHIRPDRRHGTNLARPSCGARRTMGTAPTRQCRTCSNRPRDRLSLCVMPAANERSCPNHDCVQSRRRRRDRPGGGPYPPSGI